jgi:hypothetical protein
VELSGLRVFAGALCALVFVAPDSDAATRTRAPECPAAGTKAISFEQPSEGGFLTDDGVEVRLSGVLATDIASTALSEVLRSGPLTIAAKPEPDRYGRVLGNVFASNVWVQSELLRRGEVRASPDLANGPCANLLLKAEEEGRRARAGHWGDGTFRVLTPEGLRNRTGTFQIVDGRVVSATVTMGRAYINFGPDYRTDFTVTVSPDDMRSFRRARFDVPGLSGKRIRVRGWLEFYNGPEMEVATPAAIEVLDNQNECEKEMTAENTCAK